MGLYLPYEGVVTVEVYTVAAIRVRSLVSGRFLPRTTELSVYWDGTNADGRAVSAGTYLVSVRTAQVSEIRRILLVR